MVKIDNILSQESVNEYGVPLSIIPRIHNISDCINYNCIYNKTTPN